ncbi:MAG: hypothetical protein LM580_07555 [Thermofilum sp.]|nr:hypothetical protein [Thermofilum sp.]
MGGVRKVVVEAGAGVFDVVLSVEAEGVVSVKVVRGLDVVMSYSGKGVDEAAGKLVEALRRIEVALADAVKVAKKLDAGAPQGVV